MAATPPLPNPSKKDAGTTHPGNPKQSSEPGRRTGPSTGNAGGNDLPSESSTQRDTRQAEGIGETSSGATQTPGRGEPGSEVTGSTGENTPEAPK
jgi:hypothetical protein